MRNIAMFVSAMVVAGMLALPGGAQESKPAPSAEQAKRAMKALASFRHVPLTVEKAKAAVAIFLTLKKEYPPETFKVKTPGPMGAVEAMKASEKAQEILKLVKDKGFADIDEWARAFTSLGMALAHVRQGSDADIQAKLKKLDEAPMPEPMKAKIRAMLQALIPPQQNVQVAQQLLQDADMKRMIEAVEAIR